MKGMFNTDGNTFLRHWGLQASQSLYLLSIYMQNNKAFAKITESIYLNKFKPINQGSFAQVFQGCNIQTSQVIAIKRIFPDVFRKEKSLILRERDILQELKVKPHKNILKYLGSAELDSTIYFFTELCTETVEDRIRREKKIPEYLVLKWFRQLLEGLTFLHDQSILHRDLKPANILLDEFDNIKIADFGLAKHDEVVNTIGAGTPLYKAPEVYNCINYDERCDVWSAGLILYEMLTGRPFFENVNTIPELRYKHKLIGQGKLAMNMPVQQEKDYDKVWGDIVKKMTVYSFEDRMRSRAVLEMYNAIYKELEERIKKNLSYIDFDLSDVTMSLGALERSYVPQSNNHENVSIFNHHDSFTKLNNLTKYLTFKKTIFKIYQKIKVYASPKVKRNGKEFPNQYVYTLIFIILGVQLQKNQELERQLKNEEFNLPTGKLVAKHFELYHRSQFQELVKQNLAQLKAMEPELKKQIITIAGKFKEYLQRKEKKPIMLAKYDKVCAIAEEYRKTDKLPSIDSLLSLYVAHLTMNDFRIKSEDYPKMDLIELRVYYLMHALAHLDEYFSQREYASTDYLINRREKLELESKQSMIEQLKKWVQ